VRGKAGGIVGAHVAMTVTLKGLPLAYNKDMQEDKRALFAAMDELSICLRILAPLLDRLRVRSDAMRDAAAGGHANATELADYLVEKGRPFREAHEIVGRVVRHAIERDVTIEALPLDDLRSFAPEIGEDVRTCLSLESTLAQRDVPGGTAPNRVVDAIAEAKMRLDAEPA
jgi:argininosuccinate lyase